MADKRVKVLRHCTVEAAKYDPDRFYMVDATTAATMIAAGDAEADDAEEKRAAEALKASKAPAPSKPATGEIKE